MSAGQQRSGLGVLITEVPELRSTVTDYLALVTPGRRTSTAYSLAEAARECGPLIAPQGTVFSAYIGESSRLSKRDDSDWVPIATRYRGVVIGDSFTALDEVVCRETAGEPKYRRLVSFVLDIYRIDSEYTNMVCTNRRAHLGHTAFLNVHVVPITELTRLNGSLHDLSSPPIL